MKKLTTYPLIFINKQINFYGSKMLQSVIEFNPEKDKNLIDYLFMAKSMNDIPSLGNTIMGDPNSEVGVLLQHGFVGSNLEFMYLGNYLSSFGYRVLIPVLPGHGINSQILYNFNSDDWINSHNQSIDFLKNEKKNRKIILVGHSLGGTLGLINSSIRNDITGLVTIAAPVNLGLFTHLGIKFMNKVRGTKYHDYRRFEFEDERLYQHPYVQFLVDHYGFVTYKSFNDLIKCVELAKKSLNKINIPILIIQSSKDPSVPYTNSHTIFNNVQSKTKSLETLINSYHSCLVDKDKDLINKYIAEFIKNIIN